MVLNSLVVLCSPTLFRDEKKWKVAIPFYVESWERQSVQRKERERAQQNRVPEVPPLPIRRLKNIYFEATAAADSSTFCCNGQQRQRGRGEREREAIQKCNEAASLLLPPLARRLRGGGG